MFARKDVLYTLVFMALLLGIGLVYVFFQPESTLQERKQTPAAQALLFGDEETGFTDVKNESVSAAEYFGKVLVVTAWASWVPSAQADLERLAEIAAQYQNEAPVVFLAINRAEDSFAAERFLSSFTLNPRITILLDTTDHNFKNSGGYAMPETIVYNEDGDIVLIQRGEVRTDELQSTLNNLVK